MEEKPLIYQFDDVQVDVETFRVLRDGSPLQLEPKAFEVLVFLINHPGRLVEKEELMEAVWKETFVTPNALTRAIAHLRKTLGDDARGARYIETVPTRGYRFIAEVEVRRGAANGARNGDVSNGRHLSAPQTIQKGQTETRSQWRVPFRILTVAVATIVLLTAVFFIWKAQTQSDVSAKAVILGTAQLTTSPGLDNYPALSPDGNSLAWSSDRSGKFEIYVKPLTPGGRELQITADGDQNLQPAWSPDGKMIAYHSRNRGGIRTVPALGGVVRQLSDFGSRPAWSPDGRAVVFQSTGLADLNQAAFSAMPPSTLWLIPARGGPARQITQRGNPPGGHGSPAWSPDGKRIVFVSYDLGFSEVWSVTPDGKELKRMTDWRGATFYDPVFSPDGNYLYISTASGNFRLWKARISRETGTIDGEPVEVANTGAALARHLTVSPDGGRVAYSLMTMTNNIGAVRLQPGSHTAADNPTLLTQDTNYRKLVTTFSPDGKRIAYSVWRQGADSEIWLMDADGTNARQLTADPALPLGWLPSGEQLVFVSRIPSGPALSVIDLQSGKQTLLSDFKLQGKMGRLSPDARSIAYNSTANGTINLWKAAVTGGEPQQLTSDEELMGFPCWSPDGKFLAFEMTRGDDTHIAVIPSDGGPYTQLTTDRGQSWPGSWSPDGDKIAFAGLRDGVWNVWWVSRRDGTRQRVTNYTKPNTYVRYPTWSPLGRQIAYEFAETKGNIWMMELK
ncbi:MAG TPA: LpqB family beta-propeller domain-containing protein [Blastocatellia bacterium]|nr:LpqB family beta-propeller domain-containing protein [Blastocatellia bacterium]